MTTRDEQIADIRQRTSNLRMDRIKDCYHQVISAYNIASYVEFLAEMRKVQDRSPTDFQVVSNSELRISVISMTIPTIGICTLKIWAEASLVGRHGISLRNSRNPSIGNPRRPTNPDFEPIRNAANEMHEIGCSPNVLCVPIDFFLPVNKHQWCELVMSPDYT